MLACMEAEVSTYDQFLQGDVYGYVLSVQDEKSYWLEKDSCYGFFGLDDILQEARSLLANYSRKETSCESPN